MYDKLKYFYKINTKLNRGLAINTVTLKCKQCVYDK